MKKSDIQQLKKYGYKLTPQRLAVWSCLSSINGHVTPQALHALMKNDHPEIGLVTIYRTLAIFSEVGLVCEIDCYDGLHHYSLHECFCDDSHKNIHEHHHHHHLICTECSEVIEFDIDDFNDLSQKLAKQTGYVIDSHKLDVFGKCPKCMNKIKEK